MARVRPKKTAPEIKGGPVSIDELADVLLEYGAAPEGEPVIHPAGGRRNCGRTYQDRPDPDPEPDPWE